MGRRLRKRAQRAITQGEATPAPRVALVVGAGGTARSACYAAKRLGCRVLVHNRTASKAEALASRFGGTAVADLGNGSLPALSVILSTVPAEVRPWTCLAPTWHGCSLGPSPVSVGAGRVPGPAPPPGLSASGPGRCVRPHTDVPVDPGCGLRLPVRRRHRHAAGTRRGPVPPVEREARPCARHGGRGSAVGGYGS